MLNKYIFKINNKLELVWVILGEPMKHPNP